MTFFQLLSSICLKMNFESMITFSLLIFTFNSTSMNNYAVFKMYALTFQVATLTQIASNYLNAGVEAERHGTSHSSIVPYQVSI